MPLRCSTSVVLPAPLGPSTATRSPGSTREVDAVERDAPVGVGERAGPRRSPAAGGHRDHQATRQRRRSPRRRPEQRQPPSCRRVAGAPRDRHRAVVARATPSPGRRARPARRSGRTACRPSPRSPGPARASGVVPARRRAIRMPAQLAGDDVDVADHEAGDGDEHRAARGAARGPASSVGDRRRRRQHDRRRRRRACPWRRCSTPPTAPAPTAATRARRPWARGRRTAGARRTARNGTSITSRRTTTSERARAPGRRPRRRRAGEEPEGPERLPRRGHDGDDEQHGRGELALRRQAVQRPVARGRGGRRWPPATASARLAGGRRRRLAPRRRTSEDAARRTRRTWRRRR